MPDHNQKLLIFITAARKHNWNAKKNVALKCQVTAASDLFLKAKTVLWKKEEKEGGKQ